MVTAGTKQEQTIKQQTEELQDSLNVLLDKINNLVKRNPKPTEADRGVQDRADNVFDEIVSTLRHCQGLVREATEKVQAGISNKVL